MSSAEMMLDTEVFHGPLDLLLYLVDREEVDLLLMPLEKIARQYRDFLELLQIFEVEETAGYVATLAKLVEAKSMLVLPPEVIAPPEEEEEAPLEQFRENLFQQLAEYRKVREAAKKLLELAAKSGRLHGRAFSLALPGTQQKTVLPMRVGRLEIWDLVSAFGRLMREIDPESVETVSSDPTPLSQVIDSVKGRILSEGPLSLRQLFTEPRTRGRLISLFLAILELARHQGALLRQDAWLEDIVVWFDENPKDTDLENSTGEAATQASPSPTGE